MPGARAHEAGHADMPVLVGRERHERLVVVVVDAGEVVELGSERWVTGEKKRR